jgi:serine/threonine-protein kinase
MDENERPAEMPQNIGRYQVLESVGFGAMGAVYKAFDPLIKRTLAIKTIRLDIPRQSPQYKSFIDRFYHEARISGTLSHPNIVTLFDIGEESGLPYLAMEFVEGETILNLLESGQRFKPEKVIGLVSQIASAIDYAHSKGVIHRDIKPSNVILYEGEKVKVTDFGIAKLIDAEMTQSGTLLGTPSYMSPEQAMGEKLDGRSDIFSLGVCAFEMLSGEQPFPGTNVTSILYKLVHVDPIEPADLEMHGLVPQKWHEVFSRVLAKKPDDRYQTATEFVQDLEYCLGSWFGAVPDMTLSESAESTLAGKVAAAATPPAARKTGPRTAPVPSTPPAEEPVEVTVAMPTPSLEDRKPRAAAKDDVVPTVFMSARDVAQEAGKPEIEGTVVMAAPVAAPRSEPAAPPAPVAQETDGTVVMASPMTAPAHKTEPLPVAAPAPVAEGTIVMAAPVAAAAPASAPAFQAHYGPPPTSGEPEGTLVMAVPTLPARPAPPPPSPPPALAAPAPAPPTPAPPEPPPVPAAVKPPVPPPAVKPPVAPPAIKPSAPLPPPVPQVAEATAEPGTAVRRSIPIALLAGAGGLLLLLGAVAIGVVLLKNRGKAAASPEPPPTTIVAQPTPTAAPPSTTAPVAVEGSLHVETQPAGATVTVDGVVRGVTPVDVAGLAVGAHEVKIEQKGFAAETQSIDITPDAPAATINLALSKSGPAMGTVDFTTNPAGATVKLDGASIGKTPLRNYRLKLGSHRVEYTADGFEAWSGNLTVREGRKAKVDIFLKAIPKATPVPTPTPDVVDPSRVYDEGQVDTKPQRISGSSPAYPRNAPRLKERVSVSFVVVITENGDVADVRITESGGAAVDAAVAAAARGWKFTPAVKKGIKVKVRMPYRQSFLPG